MQRFLCDPGADRTPNLTIKSFLTVVLSRINGVIASIESNIWRDIYPAGALNPPFNFPSAP